MLRMSDQEFKDLQSRINGNMRSHLDAMKAPGPVSREAALARRAEKKKRNKFGAVKTVVDGISFDSKAESRRYLVLKDMQKRGEISGLVLQVRFELIPAQVTKDAKEKPVYYEADFAYHDKDGAYVVEDVKSGPTKTKEFVIKRKLLLWIHGIAIREVLMKD